MLLPLSDAPNPGGRPYVTYGLIAANILVYVLVSLPLSARPPDVASPGFRAYVEMVRDQLPSGVPLRAALANTSAYEVYVFEHGYKPAAPQLADLVFSLFLHGGFLHLFGNMLFLWIYGDNVEYRLGRVAYLLAYVGTGIAATLFFSIFALDSAVPLVGASGAISGVLGFYFLWFPRNSVRVFVFLFPLFMNVVAVPARIVLGVYLILDNLLPFLVSTGGGRGVAHGAHIGGFLAGLAGAWLIDRRETAPRRARFRLDVGPDETAAPAATGTIGQADMALAARTYFSMPPDRARKALRPDESLALGDWLAANGHGQAALVVYRRHLRDYPLHPSAAAAHLSAGLVQLDQLGQVAPAYQHFLEALDLGPDAETAARARAALARIAALQKYSIGRTRS